MKIKVLTLRAAEKFKALGSRETYLVCKEKDKPPQPWVNGVQLPFAVRKENCSGFRVTGRQFFIQLGKRTFSIYLIAQDYFFSLYK